MSGDPARAAEVWRRHRSTRWDMSGQSFWTTMTFEKGAFLAGMVFLFLQLSLEPALWWPWPSWRGARALSGRIALILLVLAPISGVLLERYLAHRTAPGTALRLRGRIVLWLAGSVPLLNLLLIPLWQLLMRHSPGRALRPVATGLDLDSSPRLPRRSRLLHGLYTSGIFGGWLVVTGVLLPLAGCFWLAAGRDRTAILAGCVALHLFQAGSLALYAKSELRFTQQSRRILRLAAWLCLLPQPATLVTLFLVIGSDLEGPGAKTLTGSAYARRGGVGRLSRWLDLQLALRKRWSAGRWAERWTLPRGLEISPPEGRAELARRSWMRTKTLLLPIEAALAAGLTIRFLGGSPVADYDPVRDPELRPWLLVTALLAGLGLLQAAFGGLGRLLRVPRLPALLDPPAAGVYLFSTQMALVFGLLAGPLAAHGNLRILAELSALSAALVAMFSGLFLMFQALTSRSESALALLLRSVIILCVGVLPAVVFKYPGLAPAGFGLALLAPVLGALLGWRSRRWLLYPFTWRDLLGRPDRFGRLAGPIRLLLGVLALSALLPLGGLFLPVWIWARRRR